MSLILHRDKGDAGIGKAGKDCNGQEQGRHGAFVL